MLKAIDIIYHADCLEGMKELPDESVDCVVTDPPYRLTQQGASGHTGGIMRKDAYRRGTVFVHNDVDIGDYLPSLYRVLKERGHFYIMCNDLNLYPFLKAIYSSPFHFVKSLIWDKRHKIMGRYYMGCYEYILFMRKGAEKPINHCGSGDLISLPNVRDKGSDGENWHDCQKPVALMQYLIEESTQAGEVVLDPFMGSGTTALACERSGRHYVGYEIDGNYYELAKRRLHHTAKQLSLFNAGMI